MYLKNAWYVAAEPGEIGDGKLLARTIMNLPMVLYRLGSGAPAALYDQCCHRQAPLSLGEMVGDELRCNYHGLRYAPDGRCTHVPGQSAVPPGASVRSFPVAERHDWIWVWTGDPALADEASIPDFWWNTHPDWRIVGEHMNMAGNYRLLVDNLLDISHLAYTHQRTIGVPELAEDTETTYERGESDVTIRRVTYDHEPPPGFMSTHSFDGRVDRWSIIRFVPPSSVIIESSVLPAGLARTDEERHQHEMQMILNAITPETDGTLHYFWRHARNYRIDDEDVDTSLRQRLRVTFDEDGEMIAGQQANHARQQPSAGQAGDGQAGDKTDITADSGAIAARRIMARMIAAEQGSAAIAAE